MSVGYWDVSAPPKTSGMYEPQNYGPYQQWSGNQNQLTRLLGAYPAQGSHAKDCGYCGRARAPSDYKKCESCGAPPK